MMAALRIVILIPATARATAPVVVIDAPDTAQTGAAVAFDGAATADPDGDLMDYAWAIDGQRLDVESNWLSVSFAHPGRHVVPLPATDPTGAAPPPTRPDPPGAAPPADPPIVLTGPARSPSSLKPLGATLLPGVTAAPEVVVRAPKNRLHKHRLRVVLRCRGSKRCKGTLRIVALKGRHQTPFLLTQRRFDIAS